MVRIILSLFLLFGMVGMTTDINALSDAEYNRLKKSSQAFREADAELGRYWHNVYDNMEGPEKKQLLKVQRNWIKSERDEWAREYMDEGYSKGDAYAKAVERRIKQLRVAWENYNLSDEDKEAGRIKDDDFYLD